MSKVKPIYCNIGRLTVEDEDGKSSLVSPYCEITGNTFILLEQNEDEKFYNVYEITLGELKGVIAMMESLRSESKDNDGTTIRLTASRN